MKQQQQQLKTLESLRNALERKAADFDNARQRSVEAAKAGIQDLRTLTDFVESSIIREIEEAFEINRFAVALDALNDSYYDERDNTEDTDLLPEVEKLRVLALEDAAPQLGPSKRDFLKVQERIVSLNNWYSKRPLHLPERIEGRCVGGDSVEVVWGKVEGAVCYHVEMRRPSEGAFLRVYEGVETRYRVSGLCAGARVLFRVRSVVGSGGCVSEWSECVEASTPAAAPQYLCAQGLSSSEIAVVWDKVNVPCGDFNNVGDEGGVTPTYHVEMRPRNNNNANGDLCGFKEIYSGSETRCTASGLESEEEYAFRVRTMAGGRCISRSCAVYGRTRVASPKRLRARTDVWDAINLSWDCVVPRSGGSVCYAVEMKEGGADGGEGEFTEIYRGARNKVRKTEFKHNTEYSFRVRAVVRDEVSEWSDAVSVKTQSIPAPSNFSATAAGSWDTIALKWDGVASATGEQVSYIVGMKENGHARFTEVYRGAETSFTKTDFEHNAEYSFRVRSVCKSGGSEWSGAVSTKTQSIPVPSNFTASTRSWGSVDLSWDSVMSKSGEAVGYVVTMKGERDSKFTEIYRGTKTNFTKTELKQDTEYSFWVRTMHKNRVSEWSSAASIKTQKLFAPNNFKATSTTSDSITLAWDKVSDASFYQVEVDGAIQSDRIKSNSFVKRGLLSNTEHSFRVRTARESETSEWGDAVKGRTLKAPNFSGCAWKGRPGVVRCYRRYALDEGNPRIATLVNNYCTIIGNTLIPLNTVTSWNISVLKSKNNNGGGIYVGVAPSDINQNDEENSDKCGWYFNCFSSKLYSGPPHKYRGKEYGPRKSDGKYVRMGDSVGVVIGTAKGDLSFILNGMNQGAAYKMIPLDKPLVPCVLLYRGGDSIELVNPEVKEIAANSSVPVPSNITTKSITWDSITLTWDKVNDASFYQVEFDGEVFGGILKSNTFVKRGFPQDTEHNFRVRTVKGSEASEWSDVVKGRTKKESFETSGWKECPDKYVINESNLRIAKTINEWCTIIGNTPLPLSAIASWSIKAISSNENDIYIGLAPFDIDQNETSNYYKCGWYANCYDFALISGPPHDYRNKKYYPGTTKGVAQLWDNISIVMDTAKGELSFILGRKKDLGVAYEGIPLDKPLVPCVYVQGKDTSVELII